MGAFGCPVIMGTDSLERSDKSVHLEGKQGGEPDLRTPLLDRMRSKMREKLRLPRSERRRRKRAEGGSSSSG